MATRQRPPRGRLRLSPTPPLTHGGDHEPPREMATTFRPEQNTRLAGRERKSTTIRTTTEMTTIETITRHHALGPDASPGRGSVVPQGSERSFSNAHLRASRRWIPRLRNLFRASRIDRRSRRLPRNRASATTSHTRTPHAPPPPPPPPHLHARPRDSTINSVPLTPQNQEPVINSFTSSGRPCAGGDRGGTTRAQYARPNNFTIISVPSTPNNREPAFSNIINSGRPSTGGDRGGSTRPEAAGAIEGEKVTFPLPIPGTITCDLCRPPVSWRRKQSKHRDALKHLQEQHDARIVAAFRCRRCGYATTTLHAGNRHLSRSCTGVRALEETPQEVGPTELREDGTLVLL